jgi:hypothetical protein
MIARVRFGSTPRLALWLRMWGSNGAMRLRISGLTPDARAVSRRLASGRDGGGGTGGEGGVETGDACER